MGARAIDAALKNAGAGIDDIGHLCCVTTTGFLTPGPERPADPRDGNRAAVRPGRRRGHGLQRRAERARRDAAWSAAHPRQLAILLCVEACSAAYVFDSTMRTAVVNSLFGDGAAAIALTGGDPADGPPPATPGPRILSFASHIITDAVGAMRYDWDDSQGKFSFYLDPDIPYVVGAHAELVDRPPAGRDRACAAATSATGSCTPAARR